MTVVLETPRACGEYRLAVLSRCEIRSHGTKTGGVWFGAKRPFAALVAREGEIKAYAIDGRPIAHSDIERLFPFALAAMKNAAHEND